MAGGEEKKKKKKKKERGRRERIRARILSTPEMFEIKTQLFGVPTA